MPAGASVSVYATAEAGDVEPPHGPADAPNPARSVVRVSGEATVDVDADPARP